VDNIPLDAARAAGVAVLNTPGANAGAVTEQTVLLMLALARGLDAQRAAAGAGARSPAVRGVEGLRLTVVGLGDIGRRVAALGVALGMAVTVVPRVAGGAVTPEGYPVATLAEALPETDVLTLHCPLTAQTRHMIDAAALAALPRGAMVVNTARGGIVDEGALAAALHAGHLGGAALDVTEVEPLPADSPLRGAPRLILTPHSATLSDGAFRRMGMEAAQNILDHAAGRPRAACTVA
jgi:D-3-phosphoglycerate dehydrogenase